MENSEALTEHEQEMVALVDAKEASALGSADPEQAQEYIEPEAEPTRSPEGEIDYKAEYEKLIAEQDTKAPSETEGSLEVPEDKTDGADASKGSEEEQAATLTPEEMSKYSKEFSEKGELSEDSYSELQKLGLSKAVVDTYIEGQAALTASRNAKVFEKVGGEEAYSEMIAWARESWSKEQIDVFNSQVQSGNEAQIMFGVESLAAQYKASVGSSPIPSRTLKGTTQASPGTSKGYANKGEMYQAMRNPLYGKDASYTQSVARKIELSSF